MRFLAICFGIVLLLSAHTAMADQPLSTPSEIKVTSANQAYLVISTPKSITRVLNNKTKKMLWSIPGWHRSIFVSNDGLHVVIGYDGINLIPVDYSEELVLITFWEKGKKIKEVRVKDIFPDKSILKRTVSHYSWGNVVEIGKDNLLLVNIADKKQVKFDLKSGEVAK